MGHVLNFKGKAEGPQPQLMASMFLAMHSRGTPGTAAEGKSLPPQRPAAAPAGVGAWSRPLRPARGRAAVAAVLLPPRPSRLRRLAVPNGAVATLTAPSGRASSAVVSLPPSGASQQPQTASALFARFLAMVPWCSSPSSAPPNPCACAHVPPPRPA